MIIQNLLYHRPLVIEQTARHFLSRSSSAAFTTAVAASSGSELVSELSVVVESQRQV
jgi:hypothetical protein